MKVKNLLLLVAFVSCPTMASAGERLFEFAAAPGYRIEYSNGQQVAIAEGASASIVLSYVPQDGSRGWISVSVENHSTEPFAVQETSLSGTAGGKPIHVLTYVDLAKEQKHRAAWATGLGALGAGLRGVGTADAGHKTTTGTYKSTTTATVQGSDGSSANGRASTDGTFTATTYDPAAASAASDRANAESAQMGQQIRHNAALAKAALDQRVLRANTLSPGRGIIGQIPIDLPSNSKRAPAPLELTFSAGTDQFKFTLNEHFD